MLSENTKNTKKKKIGRLTQGRLSERKKTAAEQTMNQAIIQEATEVAKVSIMVVKKAYNLITNARPMQTIFRTNGTTLRNQCLTWSIRQVPEAVLL